MIRSTGRRNIDYPSWVPSFTSTEDSSSISPGHKFWKLSHAAHWTLMSMIQLLHHWIPLSRTKIRESWCDRFRIPNQIRFVLWSSQSDGISIYDNRSSPSPSRGQTILESAQFNFYDGRIQSTFLINIFNQPWFRTPSGKFKNFIKCDIPNKIGNVWHSD